MYETYEQGHAQALADHFNGAPTLDFNAFAASYAFIEGYMATQKSLRALDGDTTEEQR